MIRLCWLVFLGLLGHTCLMTPPGLGARDRPGSIRPHPTAVDSFVEEDGGREPLTSSSESYDLPAIFSQPMGEKHFYLAPTTLVHPFHNMKIYIKS